MAEEQQYLLTAQFNNLTNFQVKQIHDLLRKLELKLGVEINISVFIKKDTYEEGLDEDSPVVQERLRQLEENELQAGHLRGNFRLAAIRTLMITDNDADKILKIVDEVGLLDDNSTLDQATKIMEDLAAVFIPLIRQEVGLD